MPSGLLTGLGLFILPRTAAFSALWVAFPVSPPLSHCLLQFQLLSEAVPVPSTPLRPGDNMAKPLGGCKICIKNVRRWLTAFYRDFVTFTNSCRSSVSCLHSSQLSVLLSSVSLHT